MNPMGVIIDVEDEGLLMEASALDSFLGLSLLMLTVLVLSSSSEDTLDFMTRLRAELSALMLSESIDEMVFIIRLRKGDDKDPSSRSVEPLLLLIVVALELYCTFDYPSLISMQGRCCSRSCDDR